MGHWDPEQGRVLPQVSKLYGGTARIGDLSAAPLTPPPTLPGENRQRARDGLRSFWVGYMSKGLEVACCGMALHGHAHGGRWAHDLRNLKQSRVTGVLGVGDRVRPVVWDLTAKGLCHKDAAPTEAGRE